MCFHVPQKFLALAKRASYLFLAPRGGAAARLRGEGSGKRTELEKYFLRPKQPSNVKLI